MYYDRKEIGFVWQLHSIKDGGDVKMKKVFNKRILQIIGSMILFSISFILCHYTHLAALHGKSDAPIIVGILGIIALFISYIFNLKALTITATFGYIIAFLIGVYLDTDGIVPGHGAIHELWAVWLVTYCIFIGIGVIYDFIKRLRINYSNQVAKSKNVMLYIGLLVGILISLGSIFAYITKPLTIHDVIQHKPNFRGTVVDMNDDHSILVKVNENEAIIKCSDKIFIPLDVKMKGVSARNFDIGDEIRVYYDGSIAESYPAQINEVYAIFIESFSE